MKKTMSLNTCQTVHNTSYKKQHQETACTSRFEITDVLVHGTEGRTGSDASPLHGAARTGKPLRLHGVARMYGCCLTANRTSILQQNLSHRDPNEPGSARPAVRELHSSTDLHGMPDLDHCTELHGTHAAALQASRGCTSLHGSFLNHGTRRNCAGLKTEEHSKGKAGRISSNLQRPTLSIGASHPLGDI